MSELQSSPKEFYDKHGKKICAGCLIKLTAKVRKRERSGECRVAYNGMSGERSIVPDEGELDKGTKEWVTFRVGWSGACLVAEREECSDFDRIQSGETKGKISLQPWRHLMGACFDSSKFEVMEV